MGWEQITHTVLYSDTKYHYLKIIKSIVLDLQADLLEVQHLPLDGVVVWIHCQCCVL